jgi:hypothetical protein
MATTIRCTNCWGILSGAPQNTNDTMCTCINPNSSLPKKGWECPRCNKIHSPYKETCECKPAMSSVHTFNPPKSTSGTEELGTNSRVMRDTGSWVAKQQEDFKSNFRNPEFKDV